MFDEPERVDAVDDIEDELAVFGRILAAKRDRGVEDRHPDRLALVPAEGETVAEGEPRVVSLRVDRDDRLGLGHLDARDLDLVAGVRMFDTDREPTDPDLRERRVDAPVPAEGAVAERRDRARLAPGELLEDGRARGREQHRFAGAVERLRLVDRRRRGDEVLRPEDVDDVPEPAGRLVVDVPVVGRSVVEREVEQPLGVVFRRAQHLAAGHVLVRRRHPTGDEHVGGVDRRGGVPARERGPVRPEQERGLRGLAL